MGRNIYFIVCIVILLFTFCIIIQVQADVNTNCNKPPSQEESCLQEESVVDCNTSENTSSDQVTSENLVSLFRPIIVIFNILYIILSYIWTLILYILSPVFWILSILYNTFILTPYTITQKINNYFYPLYMFLATAALLGILIGGMAGWFSEVIARVLVTPTSDELAYAEHESSRLKSEKVKRRAQALANLRARNGGRIPEEFYDKYASVRNKQGIIQQKEMMEGYETNPYYDNMDYRNYAGIGVGER